MKETGNSTGRSDGAAQLGHCNMPQASHVHVQAAIEKERVLGKVMERPGGTADEARFAEISKQRDIPEWSVPHYLTDLYQLSLSSDPNTLMLSSFTDRITDLVAQVCLPADGSWRLPPDTRKLAYMPPGTHQRGSFVPFSAFFCTKSNSQHLWAREQHSTAAAADHSRTRLASGCAPMWTVLREAHAQAWGE